MRAVTSTVEGCLSPIYVLKSLTHLMIANPVTRGVDLLSPADDMLALFSTPEEELDTLQPYETVPIEGGLDMADPAMNAVMLATLMANRSGRGHNEDLSDGVRDGFEDRGRTRGTNRLPDTNEIYRMMNNIPREMREFFEEQYEFMREFPDKFKETLINMAIAHNYGVYITQLATIINGIEQSSFDMLKVDAEHFRSIKSIICAKISEYTSPDARLCMSILANPRVQSSANVIFQNTEKRANLSLFGRIWNNPAAYNTVLQFWNGVKNNSSLKGTNNNVPIFNMSKNEFSKPHRNGDSQQLELSLKPGVDLSKMLDFPDEAEKLAGKRFKKHVQKMRYLIYLLYGNSSENLDGKKDPVAEIREKWWSQVQAESLLQQSRCSVEGLKGMYEGIVKTLNFCMDLDENLEFGSVCAPAPVLTLWRDSVLTNLGLSFFESGGLGTLKRCEDFTGVSIRGLKDYCKPRDQHPQKSYGAYRVYKLATMFSKLLQSVPRMHKVTNRNIYQSLKKNPGRIAMAWMEKLNDAWYRRFEEDSHGEWYRAKVVSGFTLRDFDKPVRV